MDIYKNLSTENIENEIWKDIENYEGYKVSNMGRIKSLKGKTERILKQQMDRDGYLLICLSKTGAQKIFKVHRLVAKAFIPNTENKSDVNHKNECKTDNRVINLEWTTRKENINYGTRNERISKARMKQVLQFTLEGELAKEWNSIIECRCNGFSGGNISQCCNNKYGKQKNVYKGHIWKYR